MTREKFVFPLAIKTQPGSDQIYEGFSCSVKTKMIKQVHSKYEEAKKGLVFTAILGPSFTLKKVLPEAPV